MSSNQPIFLHVFLKIHIFGKSTFSRHQCFRGLNIFGRIITVPVRKPLKAILNNRQRQNKKSDAEKAKDQIREIAARIDNEEEFVLPEDDMISTDDENDEELSSMAFLDGLSQSKQIEKLEKERKRRINNQGEDFEIEKRRLVLRVMPSANIFWDHKIFRNLENVKIILIFLILVSKKKMLMAKRRESYFRF